MKAPIPLFKIGTEPLSDNEKKRSGFDGFTYADINKIQEQIGNTFLLNSDFGNDSDNDIDDADNLTKYFNALMTKVIGDSNDGKKGKILENGDELLPSGMIIMVAGTARNSDEVGGNIGTGIAGLDSCPDGYIECSNQIISSLNSIFGVNPTPDMRESTIRGNGVSDVGGETETDMIDYFNGLALGYVGGNIDHRHDHEHLHDYSSHFHNHGHIKNHSHIEDHTHQVLVHNHNLDYYHNDHTHKVSGVTSGMNNVQFPNVHKHTPNERRHFHKYNNQETRPLEGNRPSAYSIAGNFNSIFGGSTNSVNLIERTQDNSLSIVGLIENLPDDLPHRTPSISPIPRHKVVKYCMKI